MNYETPSLAALSLESGDDASPRSAAPDHAGLAINIERLIHENVRAVPPRIPTLGAAAGASRPRGAEPPRGS